MCDQPAPIGLPSQAAHASAPTILGCSSQPPVQTVGSDQFEAPREESDWIELDATAGQLLRSGHRAHVSLRGRYITVLRVRGHLRAIDAVCYHAGGPLGLGDVEDAGDDKRPCLRCPWHHYLIDLENGTKWHVPLQRNSSGKLVPAGWKSSAVPVHRVHDVQERDTGFFVRLSLQGECESDKWANREDCFRPFENAQHQGGKDERDAALRLGAICSGDGHFPSHMSQLEPSGQVMQRGRKRTSPPFFHK